MYGSDSSQMCIRDRNKLNHFDQKGNAVMVDVSGKIPTSRTAVAKGKICVCQAVMDAVKQGTVKIGDVLGVARVAGIMAVKQTSHLIPMCHPLMIQKCSVDFELDEENLEITAICTAKMEGQTGEADGGAYWCECGTFDNL